MVHNQTPHPAGERSIVFDMESNALKSETDSKKKDQRQIILT